MNEWEWRALEDRTPVDALLIQGREVRTGQRVRLRPRARGDVLDVALVGKIALIAAIEQDYEGNCHLAVVLDDDPGKDLGLLRQPGHQFFFAPDEVEPCEDDRPALLTAERPSAEASLRTQPILVAGIGNIFLGDDGFGVEVVRRLRAREWPEDVKIVDYGIRGLDLTYALIDACGPVILVDTCSRGSAPGTLYVVEPTVDPIDELAPQPVVEPHAMNPVTVLRSVQAMGGTTPRVLLVGCEPETFGPEEGALGLSASVGNAVDRAVSLVGSLVHDIRAGRWPGGHTTA
jgi:hydrogenase maturation protease